MDNQDPLTVFVPQPAAMSSLEAMGHIQDWLERQNIEPRDFRLVPRSGGGFEISFQSDAEVALFRRQFTWFPL